MPDPGDSTGTLTWTPTYEDSGSYTVTFTAANALDSFAATQITVISSDPEAGPMAASTRTAQRETPKVPRTPGGLRATAADALIDLESGIPSWKVTLGSATETAGPVRFARVTLGFGGREIAASQVHPSAGDPAALDALFDRDELRKLFAGLGTGRRTVELAVTGERADGTEDFVSLAADVVGAAAPMRPVVSPNPVRSHAAISFATSRPGHIRADLFDASGRRVRQLTGDAQYPAGWHTFAVDGRDDRGSALPAGMYFYRIVSADGNATGRFILLK